jgi:AhpD family alkylhydroperoxidase
MTVSQYNGCSYCVAAHTGGLLAKKVSREEILQIRRGEPSNPKYAALITFTLKVMDTKGFVSKSDLAAFKNAGFSDVHAAEITVIIAQKTLPNYFNHINDTVLDLPAAPAI